MRKDLTGQVFNRLTIIGLDHLNKRKQAFWKCQCDCGNETVVQGYKITSGTTMSCGCMRKDIIGKPSFKDLTGKVFGKLTVLGYAGKTGSNLKWYCRCECGNTSEPTTASLQSHGTTSCGCAMHRHKMSGTDTYRIWAGMKARCFNPISVVYKNYGGRGITVCDRWANSFEHFYADMGERPSKEYSIDRINNDGDYTPDNCRWATRKEQSSNQRRRIGTRLITHNGVTMGVARWAEHLEMPYARLISRISRGWSIQRAFYT